MMTQKERGWICTGGGMNRRQFLKTTGTASAALGSVGLGFYGRPGNSDALLEYENLGRALGILHYQAIP